MSHSNPDYSGLTTELFVELVTELAEEDGIAAVVMIPGVYEILAEYYNNDVLDRYLEREGDEDD